MKATFSQSLLIAVVVTSTILMGTLFSSSAFVEAGCTFDSDVALQDGITADLAKPAPDNLPPPNRIAGWAPMRIVVSTLDLDDSDKYCTAEGQSRPDFKGGSRTCTADDIFTTEKKNQLINEVLPHAVNLLKQAFSVKTLLSNLQVGGTSQCSGGFNIPSEHTSSGTGVANADYVLYVAAGPTATGNVAWAGGCQYDNGSPRRIIVGRANFGPKYLKSTSFPVNDVLATGVHEILHALGYSYSAFTTASITSSITVRGITKNVITSANAKAHARAFLGCGSVPGVELENEGGSGSANSHPDRRLYKDDVMAATAGEALSTVTLAIMQDLGVYDSNYSMAENMVTGKRAGCGFAEGDCTTTAGGKGDWWCSTHGTVGCTSNLKGYGPCQANSPQFTDNCPYFAPYSNRHCTDTNQNTVANSGDVFHSSSRCFETTNSFRQSGSSSVPSSTARCLKAQCVNGIVSFAVGDGSSYAACTSDGQVKTYTGYDGNVICPNMTRMCESLKKYANGTSASLPIPPATPVTVGNTNRATDYIYTAKTTLVVTGTGWPNIIRNNYNALLVAIVQDIAQWLTLEQQQCWLRQVSSGTSTVTFLVTVQDPNRTPAQIQERWQTALNEGGRTWMPRTANLYDSNSGTTDTPALGSASTVGKPDNLCVSIMPSMEEKSECDGMIAGIAIAVVAVLAIIGFTVKKCCCEYEAPPNKGDAYKA